MMAHILMVALLTKQSACSLSSHQLSQGIKGYSNDDYNSHLYEL